MAMAKTENRKKLSLTGLLGLFYLFFVGYFGFFCCSSWWHLVDVSSKITMNTQELPCVRSCRLFFTSDVLLAAAAATGEAICSKLTTQ